LDDNFASTVHGIEEGRLIFANLKKSIKYTMSHIIPEVVPNILFVIVPIPIALAAIQVVVIDLGFELFMALTYAWDKPETKQGLMKLPPRKPVTPETTLAYREHQKRLLRLNSVGAKAGAEDLEDPVKDSAASHLSWYGRIMRRFRWLFMQDFWDELRHKEGGETLVDRQVLVWAYLEAGTILSLGCLTAYFVVLNFNGITPYDARAMAKHGDYFSKSSPSYTTASGKVLNGAAQTEALAQAQSIFYLSVMIGQMFNLFVCKCRLRLPFGRYMFSNVKTFYGLMAGAALAMLVVYVPPFNYVFVTSYRLLPYFWFIPAAFGVFLMFYATVRTLLLKYLAPIKFNPEIAGLQMQPTVMSTRSMTASKQP